MMYHKTVKRESKSDFIFPVIASISKDVLETIAISCLG